MKKSLLAVFIFILGFFCSAERAFDLFFEFTPTILINTDGGKDSAPSPAVYPVTIGAAFPKDKSISFAPSLSFFTNYYLLTSDGAEPAEIENRTATSFSFLFDFPAAFNIMSKEKHSLSIFTGPAVFARFGVLANGVKDSDPGFSGTAGDDVKEINSSFWEDASFLYLSGKLTYLYKFSDLIKAGPHFNLYLPLGSLFNGKGLNACMIGLGVTARF